MEPVSQHEQAADAAFDGGNLDCGNGLLLLIRQHLDKLQSGQLLEVRSTEISVEGDLPSWCNLTGNKLISWTKSGKQRSFLIAKTTTRQADLPVQSQRESVHAGTTNTIKAATTFVPPLAVMGIGSWPRPAWMLSALHEYLEGRLGESEFQATADNAVRLVVSRQLLANVDVVTDGEQRRDNYASFVGKRLENCQLVPLLDLLAMVDDPDQLRQQFDQADIPAAQVRHPVVTGVLERRRPLAVHEFLFLRQLTDKPIKIALPGPYLLTRTMWLHCLTDKVYQSRQELAADIVKVLREELHELIAEGAAIVQFDEPVLTEVVFAGETHKSTGGRTFMCGALSERLGQNEELEFASGLLNDLLKGFPRERLAVHICRGNWSADESVALSGGYEPLLPLLKDLRVGTLFLEYCTPRAGEIELLTKLPQHVRIGLGVTNPKDNHVENVDNICRKVESAAALIGHERLFLNPDCGFATFADSPISSMDLAQEKLAAMVAAAQQIKSELKRN